MEKRINCWCHRFLFRAGRLILIKLVLEATPVFWMYLAWIPRGILHRIQQACYQFLWKVRKEGKPFAWVKWNRIATPKNEGGWGLNQLPTFAQALAAKQGWLLLKRKILWSEVITHKYIWPLSIIDWIRRPSWNRNGISVVWRAILNTIPIIRDGLLWKIGNGASVRIGIDPWTRSGNSYQLPPDLINYLNNRGIRYIGQLGDHQNSTFLSQAWFSEKNWNIPIEWDRTWQNFLQALTESHVRLNNEDDELIWGHSKKRQYSSKQGYDIIVADSKSESIRRWWKSLWKLKAPMRTRLLMWSILDNKIPTGTYLKKRAFNGPTCCVLCHQEEESTQHLFLTCAITISIWTQVLTTLNLNMSWHGADLLIAWDTWWGEATETKTINFSLLVPWHIWLKCNLIIFQDKPAIWNLIPPKICSAFEELPTEENYNKPKIIRQEQIDKSTPWAYFDGDSQPHGCGGGIIFHLTKSHSFHISMGLGHGTNNHAELISLQHLNYFAILQHCRKLQIFGDSKNVIEWFNNTASCNSYTLRSLMDEIVFFKTYFDHISCSHIYMERNESADKLSKEAMNHPLGEWMIIEHTPARTYQYFHRPYIDMELQRGNSP